MANTNNTQREDNVSDEIASELEKLGFNWKSNFYYKTKYPDSPPAYSFVAVDYNDPDLKEMISAPSYDMVLDWLLVTYNCKIGIHRYFLDGQVNYLAALSNQELQAFIVMQNKKQLVDTNSKKDTIGEVIKHTLLFYNKTSNNDGGEN